MKKYFLITLSLFLAFGFTFQKGQLLELTSFLNARSSAKFYSYNKNVITTLATGTQGEVQEFIKFKSNNYGIKTKVSSGPHKGEVFWLYYNVGQPAMKIMSADGKLLNEESFQKLEPKKEEVKARITEPTQVLLDVPETTRSAAESAIEILPPLVQNLGSPPGAGVPCPPELLAPYSAPTSVVDDAKLLEGLLPMEVVSNEETTTIVPRRPAAAHLNCTSEDEAKSFEVRILQSEMQIYGLSCLESGSKEDYAKFVTKYSDVFAKQATTIMRFYNEKKKKRGGQDALDSYVTLAANKFAGKTNRVNNYCEKLGEFSRKISAPSQCELDAQRNNCPSPSVDDLIKNAELGKERLKSLYNFDEDEIKALYPYSCD